MVEKNKTNQLNLTGKGENKSIECLNPLVKILPRNRSWHDGCKHAQYKSSPPSDDAAWEQLVYWVSESGV